MQAYVTGIEGIPEIPEAPIHLDPLNPRVASPPSGLHMKLRLNPCLPLFGWNPTTISLSL